MSQQIQRAFGPWRVRSPVATCGVVIDCLFFFFKCGGLGRSAVFHTRPAAGSMFSRMSPNHIKRRARASISAIENESSSFFVGPLVKKPYKTLSEQPFNKIQANTDFAFFFNVLLLLLPRPLPVIALTHEIITFRNDRGF